jgi:D-alanyl-D-alanine carboxypeptidase
MRTGSLIFGRKENLRREIASLTKMMTFYTVIELIKQFKLQVETYQITVSTLASQISGTSAFLREGDTLTVSQLLYGLMLPSGNDAAFCLAEHFGERLYSTKYS